MEMLTIRYAICYASLNDECIKKVSPSGDSTSKSVEELDIAPISTLLGNSTAARERIIITGDDLH